LLGVSKMKFYVASGMKNMKLVNYYAKRLKENGWQQTHDWVVNVSDDASIEEITEYAKLEQQGVASADVVIVLLPAGRGAHIELGMAMALHKRVFLCSETEEEFSIQNTVAFYHLPNVVRLVGTADENIEKIIELEGE